jgi:hypothetical protein
MRLNVKRYLEIIEEKKIDREAVWKAAGLSAKTYQWIMDNQYTEPCTIERIADFIGCIPKEIYLPDSSNVTENVIEFFKDQKQATLTFSQGRYVSRIKKLAESHPEECHIVTENRDGSICAHIPVRWIKITPVREYTEEERQRMGERLRGNDGNTLSIGDEME